MQKIPCRDVACNVSTKSICNINFGTQLVHIKLLYVCTLRPVYHVPRTLVKIYFLFVQHLIKSGIIKMLEFYMFLFNIYQ